MRKTLCVLIGAIALCLWASASFARVQMTLQDAAVATGNGSIMALGTNVSSVGAQVTIADTATVTFEGTADGSTWASVSCVLSTGSTRVQTATATGLYQCNVAGLIGFRARISVWSAGAVTVKAVASEAVFASLSGGGTSISNGGGSVAVDGSGAVDITPTSGQDFTVSAASDDFIVFSNGSIQFGTGNADGWGISKSGVTYKLGRPSGTGGINSLVGILQWASNSSFVIFNPDSSSAGDFTINWDSGVAFFTDATQGNVGLSTATPAGLLSLGNAAEGGTAKYNTQTYRELVTLTSSAVTTFDIPSGARMRSCQMNVNTAVSDDAGDDTWTAALSGGSTTAVTSGATAAAVNTKVNKMFADEITSGTTNVTFTPQGGSFDGGIIEVLCVADFLTAMADV